MSTNPTYKLRLSRRPTTGPAVSVVETLDPGYRLAELVDLVNAARERRSYVRLRTTKGEVRVTPSDWDSVTVTLDTQDE